MTSIDDQPGSAKYRRDVADAARAVDYAEDASRTLERATSSPSSTKSTRTSIRREVPVRAHRALAIPTIRAKDVP